MMNCKQFRECLDSYLDGELSAAIVVPIIVLLLAVLGYCWWRKRKSGD